MKFYKLLIILHSLLFLFQIQASEFSDKLLLTSGVSQLEGSAGGGLTPWAFIGSYATEDQIGASAFFTNVKTSDYNLHATGFLLGFYDRLELSFAHQVFDTRDLGDTLGLGQGFKLKQNVVGLKVRLFGNGVLDQDTWRPQVSLGLQYKKNNQEKVVKSVGAKSDEGVDVYLASSKIFLAQRLLTNLTLRATKANQLGILGFGGDAGNNYEIMPEFSVAYLLTRKVVIGAEYRFKPNNLKVAKEEDWFDIFVAWAPTKNFSLTLAYAHLGNIVLNDNQNSIYSSIQIGF